MPSVERERSLRVALERAPADRVVRELQVLDVHTGTTAAGGVAIAGERIAYVGEVDDLIGPDTQTVEGRGRVAVPGLIDGHIHTYESHLPIAEVARGMVRHGVTTIVTDFYGEAVVRGPEAIRASLDEAAETALNVVFVLPMPALYQDSPFVHTGTVDLEAMEEMARWPECHGLNECFVMNLVTGEPMLRRLVDVVQEAGGKVCGHGSEAGERQVQAWAGWVRRLDDHEAISAAEAFDRLRAGIHIIAREGSGVSDVANILGAVVEGGAATRRISFCTDILSPVDLLARGSIDHCVRLAIEAGVPAVEAVQMATLNGAECHLIDHDVGSIAPGRRADLILLDGPLERFAIDTVLAGGRVVVEGGQSLDAHGPRRRPAVAYGTVDTGPLSAASFAVPFEGGASAARVRVIGVADGTIVTRELVRELPVDGGALQPAPDRDIAAIASVERHGGSGAIGRGFVEGFGLRAGAVASTYNPHCQHMLVLGADPESMAVAAAECAGLGGGFVVAAEGAVRARVPLPLYGLLSEEPVEVLSEQIEAAIAALRELGCELTSPFHTLAFVGLPVSIGRLKICSAGLVDVWRGETVPLLA